MKKYGYQVVSFCMSAVMVLSIPSMAAFAEESAPAAVLEIGTVSVSAAELEENDYMVEVPVMAFSEAGFGSLQFGFSWDSAELDAEAPSGKTPDGISLHPVIDDSLGWVQVFATGTYYDTEICTLRFRVPEDSQPGQVFEIHTESSNADGDQAEAAAEDGSAEALTLQGGSIRITETKEVDAHTQNIDISSPAAQEASVTIQTKEVTVEELEENAHLVQLPVTISGITAFSQLELGASWNTNDLNIVRCDSAKNFTMEESYYGDGCGVWMPFQYEGTLADGTVIGALTFRVRGDVEPGDVLWVTADAVGYDEETAAWMDAAGQAGTVSLTSGSIRIIAAEETEDNGAAEASAPASTQAAAGDVNLDGELNVADLVLIDKVVRGSGASLSEEAMAAADVNGDSCVDDADEALLLELCLAETK